MSSDGGRSVGSSHSSGVTSMSNVSDLSEDSSVSSHHFVEGSNDVSIMGETVSLHNME